MYDGKNKLLYEMIRIRRIEEEISKKYSEQQMRCPVHLSIGQEAVAVGVSSILENSDKIVSAHRSHAHYLAKGGSLNSMIAELYGKASGCCKGKGGSMHLFDLDAGQIAAVPIVGSSIPIGTGVAWQLKLRKSKFLVVVYLGDGATEEGTFAESLNFASLHSLPIIYVCEDNQYSVYTHRSLRQGHSRNLQQLVNANGIKTLKGDGNNVLEVQRLSYESKDIVQSGLGPVFIELSTYRWLEHCGPNWDNELGYRKRKDVDAWVERCPINQLISEIKKDDYIIDKLIIKMEIEIAQEIRDAFLFAQSSNFPSAEQLFEDIYQ